MPEERDSLDLPFRGIEKLSGLAERIIKDEFAFVNNNRFDFLRLFAHMDLHAVLVILVPKVVPSLQRLFNIWQGGT